MTRLIFFFLFLLAPPVCAALPHNVVQKTLNNMGYMALTFDEITLKFLDDVRATKGSYLDAGAAFGSATLAALKAGANHVIAIDLNPDHISILNSKITDTDKARVKTVTGDFPDDLEIPPESLDGILIARLLHFFDGPKIQRTLKKVHTWLKPGAKAYIITVSPQVHELTKARRIMKTRIASGEKWPGYFENIWPIAPAFINVTPQKFNVLTQDVLTRAFKEAGLKVIYAKLSGFTPWAKRAADDGTEILGFVVQK